MAEPIEFSYGDIIVSIEAVQERLDDPSSVLKELSRKITSDIKANIASGGTGWPPYAESTKKRLESTGTSLVSNRGTIRSDRIKKTSRAIEKLHKQVRERGRNPELVGKLQKLEKRLQGYRAAEERAAKRDARFQAAKKTLRNGANESAQKIVDAQQSKLGARQSVGHALLHRIPGTIRSKLSDKHTLYIYSRAGKIGDIHNRGEGKTPKREFIPPPNMNEAMDYFKLLMESDLGQAWEQKKS